MIGTDDLTHEIWTSAMSPGVKLLHDMHVRCWVVSIAGRAGNIYVTQREKDAAAELRREARSSKYTLVHRNTLSPADGILW